MYYYSMLYSSKSNKQHFFLSVGRELQSNLALVTTISSVSVVAIVVVILVALCVILVVACLVVRNRRKGVFVPNNNNTFQNQLNFDGLMMKNDAYIVEEPLYEEIRPIEEQYEEIQPLP